MQKNKPKEQSTLVRSILALDEYFAELTHLGSRIEVAALESDSDFEQMQRLMGHFNRCGESISGEIITMSTALNEARAKAEAAAKIVAARAEEFQKHQAERQQKLDEFKRLAEKVQALNASLRELKHPEGEQDQEKISTRLSEVEVEIQPLIDEAQALKTEARNFKMKALEQGAESLGQSLVAVSKKLSAYHQAQRTLH